MPVPSHVREPILAEHRRMRRLMQAVIDAQDVATLRPAAQALFAALRTHVANENDLLLPALESIDAWGPLRADKLGIEHETQLAWIEDTERHLEIELSDFETAHARLASFVTLVESEMKREEREVLDESRPSNPPAPYADGID
jgi:hypothetical protein